MHIKGLQKKETVESKNLKKTISEGSSTVFTGK